MGIFALLLPLILLAVDIFCAGVPEGGLQSSLALTLRLNRCLHVTRLYTVRRAEVRVRVRVGALRVSPRETLIRKMRTQLRISTSPVPWRGTKAISLAG